MPSKDDEEFSDLAVKKSTSMPRLARDRFNTNKIYRAPPTPPLEAQVNLERSFKLDCIAVSNISLDYSRANPKLGSVIPPYNSLENKNISETVKNNGVREFLRRTGQTESEHESMAGRVHDFFFKQGTGFKYLSRRNAFGNGHHSEMVDGHSRYMAEQPRIMFSYNNMFGFRRNIPKFRTEPPSTFSVDPTYFSHLLKTYGAQYSEEELFEHFKNTYMIGYPFHDNNYNTFHPTVKYIITVKTGSLSMEKFEANLGINIVARNFDTGFIKLDENILKSKSENSENNKLFKRNHKDIFQFEDRDIRTISAIILSHDGKGDELLYLDYIEVEIQKSYEKQTYRFPFDGWVRMSRQDKKTEQLKTRFGKKNSVVVFPNEKPKFEYKIKITPQSNKDTEYSINIDYDIINQEELVDLKFEFFSELPKAGKLLIGLTGLYGQSEVLKLSNDSEPLDFDENKLVYPVQSKQIGEISQVNIMYEEGHSKILEYNLRTFNITDSQGQVYEVYVDQNLKANREKNFKTKIIKTASKTLENHSSNCDGQILIKLETQSEATSSFILKDPAEINNGLVLFKKNEKFLRNIDKVTIKLEGEGNYFASIKSVKISGSNGQEFHSNKNLFLKKNKEFFLRDESKKQSTAQVKTNGEIMVQIIGEKKKTGLFALKSPVSGEDNTDVFSKVDSDLGKIKNVLVKYQDKSENSIEMNFIEIIDPRGNGYKFKTEMTLNGGQEVMLPRVKNSEEILVKESSALEEEEKNEKPKRKELKHETKSEYESKINKTEPNKTKKETKNLKKTSDKSPPAQLKREATKVEFKKEPTTIEPKKEQSPPTPAPAPIILKKESSKPEIKKEPSKVEFKKEVTQIELKKSNTTTSLLNGNNIEYEIKVIKGSGVFGAPISLVLIGDEGSTNTLDLNSKNSSIGEINKIDEFKIEGKNVGKILKMNLSYEGKELESVWFLNSIEILKNGETFIFPIEKGFVQPEVIELEVGKKPIGLIEKNLTDISVKSNEKSFVSGAKEASIVSGGKKASIASGLSSTSGKKTSSRAGSVRSNKSSIHKSEGEE